MCLCVCLCVCVCVCVCLCVCVCMCLCVWHGGADGRALVMTSGILYFVTRVEGSILVEATLSQFP